jgi:hypothetical protein
MECIAPDRVNGSDVIEFPTKFGWKPIWIWAEPLCPEPAHPIEERSNVTIDSAAVSQIQPLFG